MGSSRLLSKNFPGVVFTLNMFSNAVFSSGSLNKRGCMCSVCLKKRWSILPFSIHIQYVMFRKQPL